MKYTTVTNMDFSEYKEILAKNNSPNLLLAEKAFNIYRDMNIPNKKYIFSFLIAKDFLSSIPCNPDVQKFQSIIETLEAFKFVGLLEQVMSVVSFFFEQEKIFYETINNRKDKLQTQKATQTRQDALIKYCLATEKLLQQVELLHHPQHEPIKEQLKRNAVYSEKTAVRTIFRQNEGDIVEKLKACGIKTDFEKEFRNCFIFYTNFYIKHRGCTYSGHIKEKRASRSDESKKRSSKSAEAMWKKRRKN